MIDKKLIEAILTVAKERPLRTDEQARLADELGITIPEPTAVEAIVMRVVRGALTDDEARAIQSYVAVR